MKYIRVKWGMRAIADDEDYDWLSQFKWRLTPSGYVYRLDEIAPNQFLRIMMHRAILLTPHDKITDHINGNTLDNRRGNLRICTSSQNQANRRCTRKTPTTSRFKGVSWHAGDRRWQAKIGVNRQHIYIGEFKDETDAARAYNEAAKKYFGEFARLNPV